MGGWRPGKLLLSWHRRREGASLARPILWIKAWCPCRLQRPKASWCSGLKGTPDPGKAKIATSQSKQMVLAFFDQDIVYKYTNYIPRDLTINTDYIVRALCNFMKALQQKRPPTWPLESLSSTWTVHQSPLLSQCRRSWWRTQSSWFLTPLPPLFWPCSHGLFLVLDAKGGVGGH